MNRPTRIAACAAAALALVLSSPAARAAGPGMSRPEQLQFPRLDYTPPEAENYRVSLRGGMVAYLVPDRALPLVTITVLMRIGPDLDPLGKQGLAQGTMYLLTRSGTAGRTAAQLEDRVAFLGAQLQSQMGGGGGGFGGPGIPVGPSESFASINLLSKDLDEGLGILTDCLKSAAFEEDRVTLARQQLLQTMQQRNDDSGDIESREWGILINGEGHWSNRYATRASVEAITREDMVAFLRRYLGPKNMLLAVSGDFDRAAMIQKLEKVFASWPTPGERPGPPAGPAEPTAAGWFLVDKDVNQGRVSIGLRALDRYDPDFFPGLLMNDVLGGGGFSSRLVNRIRSDEGLAYSVRSSLDAGAYYPGPWRTAFQSKVRSVAYATSIAFEEIRKIREAPVTDEELELAKSRRIEGLPAFFETAGAIANVLAVDELTGRYARDPSYYATYRDRVRAVSVADVQRAARRLLDPAKMTVLMVGNAADMLQGDPKYPVRLTTLAGGEPKRLPLRDPMTMKPIANP
ncbi:MAG: hypothetical protein A2W00_13525 [Candidatus Eisenbacteria bacterium RBG_16_71_46]|nr:MAG: hypothetical protein A2W00_13525 [Candidatus Eisenbacteria bacterium RBG_16_71_46]